MKTLLAHLNENLVNEGFLNRLLKYGVQAKGLATDLTVLTRDAKENAKGSDDGIEPKFEYDEKQKAVIYKGPDSSLGLAPNKPVVRKAISGAWLSKQEYDEYLDSVMNTEFGKWLEKNSTKYIQMRKQKEKEQEAKNAKDPVFQGAQLAKIVRKFFNDEVWKEERSKKEYGQEMLKIMNKFGGDKKFVEAYEKAITEFLRLSGNDKLQANRKKCETYKELNAFGKSEKWW
jgi:hypothetical protein